jgi:hypothetical protein
MPKFFLPATEHDPERGEVLHKHIKTRIEALWGVRMSADRIFEIHYMHKGKPRSNQVGKRDWQTGAKVFAIFRVGERGPFLICTPTRGVISGSPMIASIEAKAVLFED